MQSKLGEAASVSVATLGGRPSPQRPANDGSTAGVSPSMGGGGGDERGEVGVGILLAVTLTFVVAVGIVHIFMFLYGQAVVRSALDEGVRAGSRVEAGPQVCQVRAEEVRADLLGGKLGDGVEITCLPGASGELIAVATATFHSPLPGVPSWTVHLEATATQETDELP